MLKLVIQDDEGKTTVVPLIRDEIMIGRKEGNTIRLTERNVSRQHARLLQQNGALQIEDLDSYNGIRVNGALIQGRVPVSSSDHIQIGDYQLEFKQETQAGAAAPAAEQAATAIIKAPIVEQPPVPGVPPVPDAAPKLAVPAIPEIPARLVVVSANMAGREFLLSQPASVIGRTEDNDIVVDHRSISRHHAKIVYEQGRFAIADLQSSNGVRVNGEEYGKVELRRGDMIDLGHVRCRFVEPGEDFVFDRDAKVVYIGGEGKAKAKIMMVVAAVVVVVIAVVLVMTLGGGDKDKTSVVAPGNNVDNPDDRGPDQVPGPGMVTDVEELLRKAQTAARNEIWEDELKFARAALNKSAKNPEALRLRQQAIHEMENRDRYEAFVAYLADGDARKIVQAYRAIHSGSVYRVKATESYETFRDEYMQDTEKALRELLAQKKCDAAKSRMREAQEFFSDQADSFDALLAECNVTPASNITRKTPRKMPRKIPRKIDVDVTLKDATAALLARRSSSALQKAEQILRVQPGNTDALMVAALAACDLKRPKKAARFARKLPGTRMIGIRQRCASAGKPMD